MSWKARVHLQLAPNAPGPLDDLGVVDLHGDAQVGSRVSFLYHQSTEVGLIEHIDARTTPPTVHISLPRM